MNTSEGDIQAPVAPLSAQVHADGTADPIDPPHDTDQEWNTAAWIEQSAYPTASASGPSYIYGHACHHHVCSFTRLADAQIGDQITVTTSASLLTYRICTRGFSPKAGNLETPSCDGASSDLVLVTCAYEQGDTSTQNLVVVATLVSASKSPT